VNVPAGALVNEREKSQSEDVSDEKREFSAPGPPAGGAKSQQK